MDARLPATVALLVGFLLLAHAVLAFTKWRWVTGALEVVAAAVLLWGWQRGRRPVTTTTTSGSVPPRV